jgi:hypothetical protein
MHSGSGTRKDAMDKHSRPSKKTFTTNHDRTVRKNNAAMGQIGRKSAESRSVKQDDTIYRRIFKYI